MGSLRIAAKHHPIISLIDSSTTLNHLKQIHSQLLIIGTLNDPHILGRFVASISLNNPKNLNYSDHVLTQCEKPTLFTLNSMIRAHCKTSTAQKSFGFYQKIQQSDDLKPDNYTFNFMVRTCATLMERNTSLVVHGAVFRQGFDHDPHVQSGLIFMYAELGCLSSCRKVFDEIPDPGLVCETAIVSACAKCGDIGFAREVFDKMSERDHIAWNAMISGYTQRGQSREALRLFNSMQLEGFKINEVSMVSVLSACTHLGALDQGRWAHSYIDRNKIRITVTLGTALIDMYAKCGHMVKAMEVFWGMKERNVYTWTSALNGLASNGAGEKCLELFSLMKQYGVTPNEVTFVSVIRACSVVGLVDEGRRHFESMRDVYRIEPQLEHYGCMVDLYGRAGRLDEAMNVINKMPMKPHAGAWGALLHGSRMYKNKKLGELASQKLIELEAKNHGAYVLLSNLYADSKNWDKVTEVRRTMKAKGVSKQPGCSVIELNGEVHPFFVGDKSHPRYDEIEVMLGEISSRLKLAGFVANADPDIDEEEKEKEDALCMHSEKIAI